MSLWFDFERDKRPEPASVKRKVFVTGAAGRIGTYFAGNASKMYDLALMVRPGKNADHIASYGNVVYAELSELEHLKELFARHDTVLHLAADPNPGASWPSILENNIRGTYNVFAAAVHAKCRRIVFASSIHAVSGYPAGYQVHPDDPVNPGDLYGISKCFGEAMARHMASQHAISALCVRIGSFQPVERARDEDALYMMHSFISHRDLFRLLCACIDNEDLRFAIIHGLSDNHFFNRMEIASARELLGYVPLDSFLDENRRLADLHLRQKSRPHSESETGRSGDRQDICGLSGASPA